MAIAKRPKVVADGNYVYRKDSFDGKKKSDRCGIWESVDGKNYAACVGCGAINRFTNNVGDVIYFDRQNSYAVVESCIVCFECGTHFFIVLEGWPVDLTEDQKKVIRMVRRGLGVFLSHGSVNRYPGDYYTSSFVTAVSASRVVAYVSIKKHASYRHPMFSLTGPTFKTGTYHYEDFPTWEPAVRKMIELIRKRDDELKGVHV